MRYASVLIERTHADLLGIWGSVLCQNQAVRQAFENGVREKFPNVEIRMPDMSAQLAAALYAAKKAKGE